MMIHPWRLACDQIHLTGWVRSYTCGRSIENSAGAVVAINVNFTIAVGIAFYAESYKTAQRFCFIYVYFNNKARRFLLPKGE
jgi:hypothetical protein